jgi:lipoyl(octanoyl) transferase
MRKFTDSRDPETEDELWICEHDPVFTQGLAGLSSHIIMPGDIPVVQTNRGGQVTYHGPGQVVAYPLLNLKRKGYFVKELVYRIEDAVIRSLRELGITGHRVTGAPGIYVRVEDPFGHRIFKQQPTHNQFEGLAKIAALGIKVSRHFSYHGVALNVKMDLEPYERINPCGYAGLRTIDLSTIGVDISWKEAADLLSHKLLVGLAT